MAPGIFRGAPFGGFRHLLRGVARRPAATVQGGLTRASNPTLFTDSAEAEVEAHGRLVATPT